MCRISVLDGTGSRLILGFCERRGGSVTCIVKGDSER